MIADKKLLNIVRKFTGQTLPTEQRLSHIISRVISSEFVTPYEMSEEQIQSYLGGYKSEDGQYIELTTEDGKILVSQESLFMFELIPINESEFHIRGGLGDRLKITGRSQGNELGFYLYGSQSFTLTKFVPTNIFWLSNSQIADIR